MPKYQRQCVGKALVQAMIEQAKRLVDGAERRIEMRKVKLTITDSSCRGGYFKKGQEFIVEDLCPPLCHELWNNIYPMVYTLLNGGELDYGNARAKMFDAKCPDECRVSIHGEIMGD